MKIKIQLLYLILVTLSAVSCNKIKSKEYTLGRNNFNKDWCFVKDVDLSIPELSIKNSDTIAWENVNLPHTANIEPLVIKGNQWQGDCFYKKYFVVPEEFKGKCISLYFEGAMQVAWVYVNGEKLVRHNGGYLPFYVDISDYLTYGKENCVIVKLNNEDNSLIPPGKAVNVLDFNIYSGIYRNVWLNIKNPVHITNEMEVDHIAGGAVFVTYTDVSSKSARVNVKADVINQRDIDSKVNLELQLWYGDQKVKDNRTNEVLISPQQTAVIKQSLNVKDPKLWDPDHPYLYRLVVKVISDKKEIDKRELNIGIRTIQIDSEKGFVINGKSLKLRGTNRHQEYPYIGYALSDNANYRDAWKIKKAGFNFVRLSHYPQSQSFLNACDELGILTMDAIPGWQFFGDDEFQKNALEDLRHMVRVDRNHPSVIMWEASLNESPMDKTFMEKAHTIVHEEFPGEGVYTSGWEDYAYDVFIPARQHAKPPYYWNKYDKDKPIFIAEYGDWEYYAQNAGFNQKEFKDLSDEERNSRQLRAYGQKRLAQQALNYQEAHNSNLQGPAFGDANWLMFDYNRGYAPDIESSGIMDIFRLPKFAYYFYETQANIGQSLIEEFAKPEIFIANFYNDPSFPEVKVYSNCEEVELLVNGKSLGKQKPDSDVNSTNLSHPPFTFTLPSYTPGKLVAKGYVGGEEVVDVVQKTPGEPVGIKIWIDKSGRAIESNCNDVVFVYAAIVDKDGTICPLKENSILFSVQGDATLIGENPIKAEAGIATILLKAGEKAGILKLSASSEDLESMNLDIEVN